MKWKLVAMVSACVFAVCGTGQAQEKVEDKEELVSGAWARPHAPDESQRIFREQSDFGAPKEAAQAARAACVRSFGDVILWELESIPAEIELSVQQVKLLDGQLVKRRNAREGILKDALSALGTLSEGGELEERDYRSQVARVHRFERKVESELVIAIDEILTPKQQELMLVEFIRRARFYIGEVEFIARQLKLTPRQRELFSGFEGLARQAFFNRVKKGVDNPADLSGDEKLAARILKAENSLNVEQFRIYAFASGILPWGETLKSALGKVSHARQRELMSLYHLLRAPE
jgi:hypothetical protein